jgi:hypothetical protein
MLQVNMICLKAYLGTVKALALALALTTTRGS